MEPVGTATAAPGDKGYRRDTHRGVPPEATLARIRPHLGTMGITRIAHVTGLDRIGLPVVMVARPNSRSVAVAQGKGLSRAAAEASGVMEAVESWHAERVARPLRHAALADLRAEAPVIDVERLPRVAGGRIGPGSRFLWVEGTDLASGGPLWLPYAMVHTDYTRPAPPGHGLVPVSTNGLASGNGLAEATVHAICEVIERDATSLWHARAEPARTATRVAVETVDDPAAREALGLFAAAGIEVGLWETTSDVGIAAFRAMIVEGGGRDGHIGVGDGCHPHRGIALLRALTEAAQTRLTYVSGARDDLAPDEFTPDAIARKCAQVRRAMAGPAGRAFAEAPHRATDRFDDDLALLLDRLAGVGCAAVARVDLSRPEFGVAVVRVVIPGLEAPHDDPDYVPGPRARAAGEGR